MNDGPSLTIEVSKMMRFCRNEWGRPFSLLQILVESVAALLTIFVDTPVNLLLLPFGWRWEGLAMVLYEWLHNLCVRRGNREWEATLPLAEDSRHRQVR
jgi:hypothetical protein